MMFHRLNLNAKFALVMGFIVSLSLIAIFYWMFLVSKKGILNQVDGQARALLHQVQITRQWISDQGGIYVQKRPGVKSHPLLSHLDITGVDKKRYLFRNPALVTRELSELSRQSGEYSFNLTSLKLRNPKNAPTEFEKMSLAVFSEKGYEQTKKGLSRIWKNNETPYYEKTVPLLTEKSCLKCHADQGYKEGDIRGALTVTINLSNAYLAIEKSRLFLILSGGGFLILMLMILYVSVWRIVLKPVHDMYLATQKFEGGVFNNEGSFDLKTGDELESLSNAFHEMLIRIGDTYEGSVKALANAIEARDPYTKGHTERVAKYSVAVAREMGLNTHEIKSIEMGAVLHDIGKIGVTDSTLKKKGDLNQKEIQEIHTHPETGANIMKGSEILFQEIPAVLYHHENYDGSGYPAQLKGKDIPLVARIIAVTDSFDAMVTDRPYRKAQDIDTAIKEIKKASGTQFDPEIVKAFERVFRPTYKTIASKQ